MVELRYAADSKESDWITRVTAQRLSLFARPDETERRLFFKLRGSTLTAHAEPSYPELWRSPVKELRSFDQPSLTICVRLDKVLLTLRCDDEAMFARWVDALHRSAGTSFERFYKRERRIGKGHFSHVYQACDRSTGDKFAVKVINKDKNDIEKSKKFVRREVKVLSVTDHPNLVRAVDFFSSKGKPHIVMEYVEGGSLRELIRKKKRLSEEEARPIVRGLLQAVAYLHSVNIVHRDIKPENVLMEREDFPKLTDFGLATFVNEEKNIHSVVGTPSYVAPEVIRNVPYGPAADVWSCGVLLYFMLAGERPFTGDSREDIKRSILSGDLRFPSQLFGSCSPEIRHLINLMLNYEQRLRISAETALQHPWLLR
ncbi:putative myosin light chain kinase [Gracilariopsis chorda]|uniref:Putative myosin light chain kinase n=1 Tax=Gracilariopsis chorda TaxID=448386 RepID=A0A2V3IMZ8_9FLOR|nr:putative myosin light chain kinase [Gracilariopsis chorda]|eukprot:PXF43448.1 putative myosin light chain kinase [Gracilariopsis chorda]